MNREQLIRALRRYARKRGLQFVLDVKRGKGSHYIVELNGRVTAVQSKLDPGKVERILKQLGVDPAAL